jgi:para-nitrobenzyl esterase
MTTSRRELLLGATWTAGAGALLLPEITRSHLWDVAGASADSTVETANGKVRGNNIAEPRAALGKAHTYRYRFDWETPALDGRLKSPHTLEMPFVFNNTQVAPGLTGGASPEAVALAARVSEARIAFATRGDPSSKKSGLPPWPAYDSERRATMLFSNDSKVVNDPASEARKLMDSILNPV